MKFGSFDGEAYNEYNGVGFVEISWIFTLHDSFIFGAEPLDSVYRLNVYAFCRLFIGTTFFKGGQRLIYNVFGVDLQRELTVVVCTLVQAHSHSIHAGMCACMHTCARTHARTHAHIHTTTTLIPHTLVSHYFQLTRGVLKSSPSRCYEFISVFTSFTDIVQPTFLEF